MFPKSFDRKNPFLRFCTKRQLILTFDQDRIQDLRETKPETTSTVERKLVPKRRTDDSLTTTINPELKRDDELARLESVLFLAREPLPSRKLAQFAEIADGSRVRRLIYELNRYYDDQPCSFRIVEVAGGYQLRTRSQFASWLVRLQEVPIEIRLSATAMETLAVVAFKQPVLRATVESIRGVQCGETLRQLMEKNLVKITGRSDELGRPFLYGTTKFFLQVFGLKHLDELPGKSVSKADITDTNQDFTD